MEIVSNAFIFVLAGHDTTAETFHLALLLLAINLSSQSHLQVDIDSTLGSRPNSSWSYPNDMDSLYNSMVGTVINEVLRIIPPVIQFGKINREGLQQLTVDSKAITVPKNTYISLEVVTTIATLGIFLTRPQN